MHMGDERMGQNKSSMKKVAELLNEMRSAGMITNYALFGAIAQIRYTQPLATLDVDVLVTMPSEEGLDVLRPLYEYCAKKGYRAEGEAIRVGAWPVQFVPVFSPLTREAVEDADSVDFEGVPLRVVRADHLSIIALSVGRAKDFARILALLEAGSVTPAAIEALAARHGLSSAWERFKTRFVDA